jgi:hypothetical protein
LTRHLRRLLGEKLTQGHIANRDKPIEKHLRGHRQSVIAPRGVHPTFEFALQ